jgi:hypothetical protein
MTLIISRSNLPARMIGKIEVFSCGFINYGTGLAILMIWHSISADNWKFCLSTLGCRQDVCLKTYPLHLLIYKERLEFSNDLFYRVPTTIKTFIY